MRITCVVAILTSNISIVAQEAVNDLPPAVLDNTESFSIVSLLCLTPHLLLFAACVACLVHARRNERPLWWVAVIIFAPCLGCLVYFFVEIWPDIQSGQFSFGSRGYESDRKLIKRLEEQLQFTDTVEIRTKLGNAYVNAGQYDQAVATYTPCLSGRFADDPYLLTGLARAYLHTDAPARALAALEQLEAANPNELVPERQRLRAQALVATDRLDEATTIYRELLTHSSGEEVRCRLAMLLDETNQEPEAEELYRAIVSKARRSPANFRRQQREWIAIAKKRLRQRR